MIGGGTIYKGEDTPAFTLFSTSSVCPVALFVDSFGSLYFDVVWWLLVLLTPFHVYNVFPSRSGCCSSHL